MPERLPESALWIAVFLIAAYLIGGLIVMNHTNKDLLSQSTACSQHGGYLIESFRGEWFCHHP